MTNKVWEVMNDLEMVTSKIVSAREIIDTAAEAIQKNDYDRAETLAMAAYEFLGYYLEEFDEKFKLAWNETVKKQPQYQYTATGEKWDLYDEVMKEREYYEYSQSELEKQREIDKKLFACDKDDPSPECKGAWNSFWEENYYPEESNQYTEEELNAMCDKAELDAQVEEIRKAGGYERTPEVSKKKWILPVEQVYDDYFISFPDDLLEAAKLKEGDEVNWIDNGDGSFSIRKVHKV